MLFVWFAIAVSKEQIKNYFGYYYTPKFKILWPVVFNQILILVSDLHYSRTENSNSISSDGKILLVIRCPTASKWMLRMKIRACHWGIYTEGLRKLRIIFWFFCWFRLDSSWVYEQAILKTILINALFQNAWFECAICVKCKFVASEERLWKCCKN